MMSYAAEGENLFEFHPKRSNSSYQIVPSPTQLERKEGAEWPWRDRLLRAPVAGQWRAAGCQQSGCRSCLMLQCSCGEQPCPQLTKQRGCVCHMQTGGKWTNRAEPTAGPSSPPPAWDETVSLWSECTVLFHWFRGFECQNDASFSRTDAECVSMNSFKIKELLLPALLLINWVLRQTLWEISPSTLMKMFTKPHGPILYFNDPSLSLSPLSRIPSSVVAKTCRRSPELFD